MARNVNYKEGSDINLTQLFSRVAVAALLISTSYVQASTVSIDPGNVGDSFRGTTLGLDVSLSQSHIINFNDFKYIEVPDQFFSFSVSNFGSHPFFGNASGTFELGLLDEFGNVLFSSGVTSVIWPSSSFSQFISLGTDTIAYALFLNITSNRAPLAEATAQFFFNAQTVVGSAAAVPIPAALPLMGLALFGLGFIGRRKDKLA